MADIPNLKAKSEALKSKRKEWVKKKTQAESVIKSETKNMAAAKAKLVSLTESLKTVGIDLDSESADRKARALCCLPFAPPPAV